MRSEKKMQLLISNFIYIPAIPWMSQMQPMQPEDGTFAQYAAVCAASTVAIRPRHTNVECFTPVRLLVLGPTALLNLHVSDNPYLDPPCHRCVRRCCSKATKVCGFTAGKVGFQNSRTLEGPDITTFTSSNSSNSAASLRRVSLQQPNVLATLQRAGGEVGYPFLAKNGW